jgi:hypothetical protein
MQYIVSIIVLGNECFTRADYVGRLCFHYVPAGNQPVTPDFICTEIARSGAFLEAALLAQDDTGPILLHIVATDDSLWHSVALGALSP